jgi:hypothetical protein
MSKNSIPALFKIGFYHNLGLCVWAFQSLADHPGTPIYDYKNPNLYNPVKTLDAPEPHFQEPGAYQRPNAADTYLSETGPPVSIVIVFTPK